MTLLITFFISSRANSTYDIPAMFAFGDSTLDTGNNNNLVTFIKANFPPYGEGFPAKKATGRFSDGRLVPDYVLAALNLSADSLPAYSGHTVTINDFGVCFASAGSGLDDETAIRFGVQTIGNQVEEFRKYIGNMIFLKGKAQTKEFLSKSMFVISVGSNDIMINYYMFPERSIMYSLPQYHDFLLVRLKALLKKLYAMGARNFAVAGLPPIGCVPLQLTIEAFKSSMIPGLPAQRPNKCIQYQNDAALTYNVKLQQMIQELLQQFNSVEKSKIVYADIFTNLLDMSNNPHKYGFVETKKGCCGTGTIEWGPLCNSLEWRCFNPSQYLFFDTFHPTQAAYKVLADDFIRTVLPTFAN
ncbi:GDSL esterase/lipase At2g40250-like [Carex rostrata]